MKMVICAVRDSATDQYGNPFFVLSEGHAIRSFGDEVNNASDGNSLYRHPEDYELFVLGTYDTQTGLFDTGVPVSLIPAKQLVRINGKEK